MNLKIKKHWIFIIVLVLFLFFLWGLALDYYWQISATIKEAILVKVGQPTGTILPRGLDGKMVYKKNINLRPVAAVIDNYPDGRPPEGLERASIIYETIIEGEVTRYLAIFDYNELPNKIGPIRSARPIFIDWAAEWDAVMLHCGGSPEAMAILKKGKVKNINEYSVDGRYFWRDSDRGAPHNLFISDKLIEHAFQAKEIEIAADFMPWIFKDNLEVKNRPIDAADILIDNFVNLYNVRYHYQRAENYYERFLGYEPHLSASGKLLIANNVVVQHVQHKVLDREGRLWIQTTGKGAAEIYQDGQEIRGYWENESGRTRFYDEGGNEIKFNRGVVWIEVVFD